MHFAAIFPSMRISVDISEEILSEVMELTGEKSKSASLSKAVTEFVRRKRAKEFGRLMREGAFDYPTESTSESLANPIPPLATK
jgi:metal-responsive CopG/Arc/MetJ family transcriptional regulator